MLIKVKAFAERQEVSKQYIYQLIQEGKIQARKIGGRLYIDQNITLFKIRDQKDKIYNEKLKEKQNQKKY